MEDKYILVINPGSTTTKVAIFCNEHLLFDESIFHSTDILNKYPSIMSQYDYRKSNITNFIKSKNFNLNKLNCIVSRGGLTKPVESGVYCINELMISDLKRETLGEHACNLGPMIAYSLAIGLRIPSYVVDPVVVDELDAVARVTGYKGITKSSIFHALNHKATAVNVAKELNKNYKYCNFIVAHMGGGISIGAHKNGRVIDVNNAFDGEGPFSSERTGTLPFGSVIDYCIKNRHLSKKDIIKNFIGQGGLVSYFKTNDGKAINQLITEGNREAQLIVTAMAYNVSKSIIALLIPLQGKCDAIILTGGLIKWEYFVQKVIDYLKCVKYPIKIAMGEHEMKALSSSVLRVLNKIEVAKNYI